MEQLKSNLSIPCYQNITWFLGVLVNASVQQAEVNRAAVYTPYYGKSGGRVPGDEKNAILYIIAVLSFYSCGIILMVRLNWDMLSERHRH